MLAAWFGRLRQRCQTCSRVTLGAGVLFATLAVCFVLLSAGAYGLAWTNTMEFCIGSERS